MITDPQYYRRQQDRVRAELEVRGLDGLLVLNPVNVFYLTGFKSHEIGMMERPVFLFVPSDGEPVLMPSLDQVSHAENQPVDRSAPTPTAPGIAHVLPYEEYPYSEGIPTVVWAARQIEGLGLRGKSLGVEDNYMTINDGVSAPWYQQMQSSFSGQVVAAGDLVPTMRMIKAPEEIEALRQASFYADELVRLISNESSPGRTEEDIGRFATSTLLQRMREELGPLTPSMGTGEIVSEGIPRGFRGDGYLGDTLRAGVPIIINCVVTVGGYHGESERTGLIGKPTDRQKHLFDIGMKSQLLALESVGPGRTCGEVDAVAKEFIRSSGFEYLYGVGHGIGLLGHEPPWVRADSETLLEPNMVVCIEPGLAVPGEGSFHCSQTVLVTDDGSEPLTTYDGLHRFDLP